MPAESRIPEDGESPAPEPFRLWDPDELYEIPRPVWAVDEILLEKGTTLLYGNTNVGKSLLALDWSLRLSLGFNWFNQEVSRQYKVAYVYAEGAAGLQLRYRAYLEGFDLEDYEPRLRKNLRFIGLEEPVTLTPHKEGITGKDWGRFMETFRHWRPDFVVLDPIQEIFRGIDNKDDGQVGKVFALRDLLKNELDCGLLLVHHTNKQGKEFRGVTTWLDLADTGFVIEADERTSAVVEVRPTKNRFGAKDHKWTLALKEQVIKDRRLEGMTSVYMTGGTRTEGSTAEGRAEDIYAWLIDNGPARHGAIQDAMEFKIDNYLKKLERTGLVGKTVNGLWECLEEPDTL